MAQWWKMNMQPKSVEAIIMGTKVHLCERTAFQVLSLVEFASNSIDDKHLKDYIAEYAVVVRDSIYTYIQTLPKWRWFKKWRLRRKFSVTNLINNLSAQQLYEYAKMVYEVEGIDVKKKMAVE